MSSFTLLTLVYSILFLFTSVLKANPLLNGTSEKNVTLRQGDDVALSLELSPQVREVQWFYDNEILCSEKKCVIETSKLGVGTHKIVVEIRSDSVIESVVFTLNLLRRNIGSRVKLITPKMNINNRSDYRRSTESARVKLLAGRAYIADLDSVERLSDRKRPVKIGRSYLTESDGLISLGQKNGYDLVLSKSSKLVHGSYQNKEYFFLSKGSMRVRNFRQNTKFKRIMVGSDIQIELDKNSDAVLLRVFKKNTQKRRVDPRDLITVLQGRATLVHRKNSSPFEKDSEESFEVLQIPAGATVVIGRQGQKMELRSAPTKIVSKIIALTSPYYVLQPESEQGLDFGSYGRAELANSSKNQNDAIESANLAMQQGQFFKALEFLIPFAKTPIKDASLAESLAKASEGVMLWRQSRFFYDISHKLKPKKSKKNALVGRQQVFLGKFNKALGSLNQVNLKEVKNPDITDYLLGVANFKAQNWWYSFIDFTYLDWREKNNGYNRSGNDFLDYMDRQKLLKTQLAVEYFQDDNPYHNKEKNSDKNGDKFSDAHQTEGGFRLRSTVDVRPILTPSFEYTVKAGASGNIFLDQQLASAQKATGFVVHDLFLPSIKFEKLGGDLIFGLCNIAASHVLDSQRVLDQFGSLWSLGYQLDSSRTVFSYSNNLYNDPFPKLDKHLDFYLLEPVLNSDRSLRIRSLSLSYSYKVLHGLIADGQIRRIVANYRSINSQISSHEELGLNLKVYYKVNKRLRSSLVFDIQDRKFKKEEAREDSTFALSLSASYDVFPGINAYLNINKTSQKSKKNPYEQLEVMIGSEFEY